MTKTQKLEFEKTFAKHCEKLGISKLCRENKKAEQLDSLMFICEDFIATLDEQSEGKLKEFNVEEYYKNPERKVVTRDGREVEILKIDTKTKTNAPVIAMMDGNDIRFYTTNGRLSLERETCSDLFFADVDCDTTNDNDLAKSNEEKAKEICGKGNPCCNKLCQFCTLSFVIADVKQMAEWKDRQFKQDLDNAFKSADHVQYTNGYNDAVEKACEWLRNVTYFDYGARMFAYGTFIKDFKKAMQEKRQ